MASVLAQGKAHGLAVGWQIGRINWQVHLGEFFIATPETDLVIDRVDSRAALLNLICPQYLGHLRPDCFLLKREGAMRSPGVAFQTFPVTFEPKRDPFDNADGGEQTPAA